MLFIGFIEAKNQQVSAFFSTLNPKLVPLNQNPLGYIGGHSIFEVRVTYYFILALNH
jgi:hypothetical protein